MRRERLGAGGDAVGEQLAHDKAQVDVAGQVAAQGHGTHLGGIRGRNHDVAPEHEPAEQFADEQDGQRAREKLHKDERAREHHAGAVRALAPQRVHGVRGAQRADDLAHGIAHAETALPRRRQDVRAAVLVAKVAAELWRCVQVADELRVKGEHDYAQRHKRGPADRGWVAPACLRKREIVLGLERERCRRGLAQDD